MQKQGKIYACYAVSSPYYRLAYTVAGKRRMQTFAAYSDAREAAERIVKDLAKGSQAAALTATQSRDALAAIQRLQKLLRVHRTPRFDLGCRVSVCRFIPQAEQRGNTLDEAVTGFQRTTKPPSSVKTSR